MSATVTWVEKKGDKAGILVMSDDTRVWTPDKALGDTLVGKPIPSDWTTKQGEYGPQAFPPRPQKGGGGFAAAYRNSEAGFAKEQQRMDARTAVMQATVEGVFIKDTADEIYTWLTQASGAGMDALPSRAPEPTAVVSPPEHDGQAEEVAESRGEGAEATSEAIHIHSWKPAPRPGWVICDCGLAEKASRVKV